MNFSEKGEGGGWLRGEGGGANIYIFPVIKRIFSSTMTSTQNFDFKIRFFLGCIQIIFF